MLPPHLGTLPTKSATTGRGYVMNKMEATVYGTIVTQTFFLYSKPFCILFDSGATYSFIST